MKNDTLYRSEFEHDACGIGAVIDIKGRRSRQTVSDALTIVERLSHRAGHDAQGDTGDGVGIMLQIPHDFYSRAAGELGIVTGDAGDYGVGMFFLPRERVETEKAKSLFEIITAREGLEFLGWRDVPTNAAFCGQRAAECMPVIVQCFIKRPADVERGLDFDRRLYILRRVFEHSGGASYVASLSSRTVVYKGMLLVDQLRGFYPDLTNELCTSAIAMVHSRFSTNTFPSWERAHPNRLILHNGEINTIRGNADRMLSRDETMHSAVFEKELTKVLPVINAAGSDSAQLDNTLEFLMYSGVPLPLAVMMTVPEPWKNDPDMPRAKRDMYRYYATMMEPWDGPAAILFSDGDIFGAVLDRNGLRPARYYVTDDGRLILSSEVGVLDIPDEHIIKKSRLEPGRMLLADTKRGRIIEDDELKTAYSSRAPYGEWLDRYLVRLRDLPIPNHKVEVSAPERLAKLQKAFGYTYEDVKYSILPMAATGGEPTASMGTDIPLAVLSEHEQSLFNYFKELFAQVTNPPIDALREEIVTDTTVYLGSDGNLLEEKGENCRVIEVRNPILTGVDLLKIKAIKKEGFKVSVISLLYYKGMSLQTALDDMFLAVDRAAAAGTNIVVLSDRGVDENHVAIPSLLAVSGLEQHLVRTKKRTAVSMILESAEPREVHHFAALLGYGARAVCPYLAHETIASLISGNLLDKDYYAAVDDYNSAVLHGIVKIASKMGVSSIQSYQSAQIFEAVGISREVTDRYFTNTVSPVGGIGLHELEKVVDANHSRAFDPLGLPTDETLDTMGTHFERSGMEDHMYNPRTIHLLQKAAQTGSYEIFKQYTALVDEAAKPHTLRGLLDMRYSDSPLSLEQVESASEIVKRFKTGAMSYGSISREAHECMALAMNRLGGKSNSGEGGEDTDRLFTDKGSAIKQVASGRFGVTGEYLNSASELQIKMAQGAKPGEGGHLPGGKVYPWIARTRHSTPGVALISPPPHHDIYSIEDLAQLIYDLKCANRNARISVKLVSEAGVGTVAAGVAKAGAQVILISGYDGGTGAAPKTSIHNAGLPWELGLAETHQTLVKNGLRSRVRLETDGKLMSGRDVAIACMLGAEEFGFATAPLVTMGCVMMRVCSKDTCPVGIATQNPELRRRFAGKPEYVENFMLFVAEELREHMAKLGIATVDELVGRSDLLTVRPHAVTERAATVDMSAVLARAEDNSKNRFDPEDVYDFRLSDRADMKLLPELKSSVENGKKAVLNVKVSSTDRAFGTVIGSEITKLHRTGLEPDTITLNCRGGGGQSFGAFIPRGLTLILTGDCNDGLGKGLSGGKLVVRADENAAFRPEDNILAGNVALYGATSGEAYIAGQAGERFCVRNSGADAVAEGVGDHGCEYMTGGRVVILGRTGKNFAAGMSGGTAYVWDENRDLYLRVNKDMVTIEPVENEADLEELRQLIQRHFYATGSERAGALLKDLSCLSNCFKKIIPIDYLKMTKAITEGLASGLSREKAEEEAFYRCGKEAAH